MASRQERIETIIKKNLTEAIMMLKDPHLGFLTITDVKVSKDFSYATVLVSFYFEKDRKVGLEVLEKAKGYLRSDLASKLDTRRCPEIRFILDDGYEKEMAIERAIERGKHNGK